MADIPVEPANVTALRLGGEWVNVESVAAGFANVAGIGTAFGVYLAATIVGGAHNGERVVVPLRHVEALVIGA